MDDDDQEGGDDSDSANGGANGVGGERLRRRRRSQGGKKYGWSEGSDTDEDDDVYRDDETEDDVDEDEDKDEDEEEYEKQFWEGEERRQRNRQVQKKKKKKKTTTTTTKRGRGGGREESEKDRLVELPSPYCLAPHGRRHVVHLRCLKALQARDRKQEGSTQDTTQSSARGNISTTYSPPATSASISTAAPTSNSGTVAQPLKMSNAANIVNTLDTNDAASAGKIRKGMKDKKGDSAMDDKDSLEHIAQLSTKGGCPRCIDLRLRMMLQTQCAADFPSGLSTGLSNQCKLRPSGSSSSSNCGGGDSGGGGSGNTVASGIPSRGDLANQQKTENQDEFPVWCANVVPSFPDGFKPSSKIKMAVEWVKSIPKGDRGIIFSFFKAGLDLIEGALQHQFKVDGVYVEGELP